MDLRDRRETYNGFGNALARAVELVATPFIFGLVGLLLDRWLGTAPILTVALAALAVAGMAVRSYYGYVAEMQEHEARLFGSRDRGRERSA